MQQWERRLAKLNWAKNNPDAVRAANRRWRKANQKRYNEAAKARMQRYRQRLRVTR